MPPPGPEPPAEGKPQERRETARPEREPESAPAARTSGWAGLPPLVRAMIVSLPFGLVEVALISLLTRDGHIPKALFYIPFPKLGLVVGILLMGGIYGLARGLLLGGLLHFTKWSSGVALLLGAGLGFGALGSGWALVGGAVAGFIIGMMYEQEQVPPEMRGNR